MYVNMSFAGLWCDPTRLVGTILIRRHLATRKKLDNVRSGSLGAVIAPLQ